MKSTVTSKGQTTIPKAIRDRFHLDTGAEIDWKVEEDGQTLTVRVADSPAQRFAAMLGAFPLPGGRTTDDVMQVIRGDDDPLLRQGQGARVIRVQDFLREREAQV